MQETWNNLNTQPGIKSVIPYPYNQIRYNY